MLHIMIPVLNPVWSYAWYLLHLLWTSAISATSCMHFVQNPASNCQDFFFWQLYGTLSSVTNLIAIPPYEWVFSYIPAWLFTSCEEPIVTPPWTIRKLTSLYKARYLLLHQKVLTKNVAHLFDLFNLCQYFDNLIIWSRFVKIGHVLVVFLLMFIEFLIGRTWLGSIWLTPNT